MSVPRDSFWKGIGPSSLTGSFELGRRELWNSCLLAPKLRNTWDREGQALLSVPEVENNFCCSQLSWRNGLFSDSNTVLFAVPSLSSSLHIWRGAGSLWTSHIWSRCLGHSPPFYDTVGAEERIHYLPFERSNIPWTHYRTFLDSLVLVLLQVMGE